MRVSNHSNFSIHPHIATILSHKTVQSCHRLTLNKHCNVTTYRLDYFTKQINNNNEYRNTEVKTSHSFICLVCYHNVFETQYGQLHSEKYQPVILAKDFLGIRYSSQSSCRCFNIAASLQDSTLNSCFAQLKTP